ncbi:hypothetical protein [Paenibacillus sp. S25]|uniref:hypothetical protein n=1 Tax=Paenibacillus sp. S25 TaxID=2823905 RepID=UPI0021AC06FD|nr:hypothetical protein [Paenibacillus sp. S25]QYK61816.1 hypothetical protein KAI37_02140 [Paenibacillus sp. S25]
MTDKPRNWQEDVKLSEKAKCWTYEITFNGEGNIVAKDADYAFAQVIAGDVGISNAEIILDGLEALPYWLQQYAALEREYERFQKAAMGWNDDLTAAEKAYEGLQANCVSRGEYEATLKKLDDMTKAYHALLQDKGDTP